MSDQRETPATTSHTCQQGRYFVLDASHWSDGIGPGLEIANKKNLLLPGRYTMEPPNGDANQYPERPQLVHLPELGGSPRDFEILASIWIVSQALKRVFESVDPEAFAFTACDFTRADGSAGPQYYLCNVVRYLDALDEEASRVRIEYERDHGTGEDLRFYSISGGASLIFKPSVVGKAHVFRQPRLGVQSICDREMFEALNASNLNGVSLRDAADL
ncbi:imm11 family protein [Pseudomonas capsici]|uniref:DUF1629 domain-containing protein n=1 Tax=Pseudomonas capsici TaxID=2810614 RepID=A0ABT3BT65_9PSED|nr:DUF1629 domain-containing protein [Pseudomonas capsici]MBN6713195.1 DUF1629 domain-containing protein [Pseudomonas capsici]MBN6718187.1 DUF1629 domain-containing protein [Pseudomonas capsici]MBN6722645.1 DUF1629 domain-containing protein [Pseudomonas capsici]MCV4266707.1 DUF1629 domain-containing protein [Pseudomonas capsici]MCV4277702.1 DUF1629 domain-containing protein [Pseudomonas capsici]